MAVKQPVIWAKCGKNLNLELRTSEITSAGILGTIQQTFGPAVTGSASPVSPPLLSLGQVTVDHCNQREPLLLYVSTTGGLVPTFKSTPWCHQKKSDSWKWRGEKWSVSPLLLRRSTRVTKPFTILETHSGTLPYISVDIIILR